MSDQEMAAVIRCDAADEGVREVIGAINELTGSHRVNRAAVIVACAQVLAQNITQANGDISPDMRGAILALVDGFAMQSALQEIG